MINRKNGKVKKTAGYLLLFILVVLLFFIFSRQNEKRIFLQNENYIQDNAEQTALQVEDILSRSLKDIQMLAYWFEKSMQSAKVTPEDLKELTEKSNFNCFSAFFNQKSFGDAERNPGYVCREYGGSRSDLYHSGGNSEFFCDV